MRPSAFWCCLALAAVCCLIPPAAAMSPAEVLDADPYAARKVFYEDYWQKKIERLLSYVPGVIVCVNVELSQEVEKRVTSQRPEGTPITVYEKERESNRRRGGEGQLGKPTKGPGRPQEVPAEEESKRLATTRTKVLTSESITTYAGLVPKDVWVSVVVPEDYVDSRVSSREPRDAAPALDAEVRKRVKTEIVHSIQSITERLLPSTEDPDSFARTKVAFLPRGGVQEQPRSDKR